VEKEYDLRAMALRQLMKGRFHLLQTANACCAACFTLFAAAVRHRH
jgi:hypothetical protein